MLYFIAIFVLLIIIAFIYTMIYQKHLKKGGTLLLEIGATQKDAVCALFPGSECSLDYGSRPRVVVVKND